MVIDDKGGEIVYKDRQQRNKRGEKDMTKEGDQFILSIQIGGASS